MRKYAYLLLGVTLSLPLYLSDAFGVDISSFKENVYRPENLPGTRDTGSAETKINEIVLYVVNIILYASGSLAVLFLVIGAIRYITALGNQDRMDGAKKTIKFAVVGLLAIILAYAAVQNIIDLIYKATS